MDEQCPIVIPGPVACYNDCDQCHPMPAIWQVQWPEGFPDLVASYVHQVGGCEFKNSCYLDCDQCPDGTAWAWYVRDLSCLLPFPGGVLSPEDGCSWTNCCPSTATPPH